MRNSLAFFLLCLFLPCCAIGQSFKAYQKATAKAMKAKDYYSAMEYARLALEKVPANIEARFAYAQAAQAFKAYEVAEKAYRKVVKAKGGNDFPQAGFYLGQVQQAQGLYTKAQTTFETFLQENAQHPLATQAQLELEQCRWAENQRLAEETDPSGILVQPLKKSVNTANSEFAPLMRGDTLYYTSFRYPNKADTQNPARKISKVLYSIRAARGRTLPRRFNEKEKHTAHITFSPQGERMYYTICEYLPEQLNIRCQLYERKKDRRGRWAKPKKLPEPINLKEHTSTQPHYTYDEQFQSEVLYFVSDRPAGAGGLDLWYSLRDSLGKWSEVQNLSDLNGTGDELSPYFNTLTGQLSFSSNSYGGFGGTDLFQSQWSVADSSWVKPQNMGLPFNSSYDDLYLSYTSDTTVAYLVSNREGTQYLDRSNKSCCYDIFRVKMPVPVEETPEYTEVDLPPVTDSLWIDPVVSIPDPVVKEEKLEPTTLEDFLPLALYFDNDEPDRRTRRTTTRKSYGETFDRYYGQKPIYVEEYSSDLEEEERWTAQEEMEAFFDAEVYQNREWLDRFSEILLLRLEAGEQVEIFIKGFTSPRANSDYNLRLGQRRISSVRNHFFQYRDGIFLPYLNRTQLILSERSFGETSADQSVSADLNDRRNSIYSIGAARERRVEILEVVRNKFE